MAEQPATPPPAPRVESIVFTGEYEQFKSYLEAENRARELAEHSDEPVHVVNVAAFPSGGFPIMRVQAIMHIQMGTPKGEED